MQDRVQPHALGERAEDADRRTRLGQHRAPVVPEVLLRILRIVIAGDPLAGVKVAERAD